MEAALPLVRAKIPVQGPRGRGHYSGLVIKDQPRPGRLAAKKSINAPGKGYKRDSMAMTH